MIQYSIMHSENDVVAIVEIVDYVVVSGVFNLADMLCMYVSDCARRPICCILRRCREVSMFSLQINVNIY